MASKTDNDLGAFLEEATGLFNEERIFTLNDKSILLDEPSGKECEAATLQFQKFANLQGTNGAKQDSQFRAWYTGLVERVLPDEVVEGIGKDNLRRFVAYTGGWRGDLAIAAMRLHGIPITKAKDKKDEERGNPANPS